MSRLLVVGATQVLRPLVTQRVAAGDTVYALARPGPRLAALAQRNGVIAVAVDYRDAPAVGDALTQASPDGFHAAVLYCPGAGAESVQRMRATTSGRVVRLLTSAAAAPEGESDGESHEVPQDVLDDDSGEVRLLLGWATDGAATRWHTPEEISAAALDALTDGQPRVLGAVRPWTERPS